MAKSLRDVSNVKENLCVFPSKDDLTQYRVLVTTLMTAGTLVSANFDKTHFSYVIIDEAGQVLMKLD